jgi:hypothetical protein
MAISTIKSQAGVTEVLLGDTVRYSYYHYPIAYLDASYAYMTTRVSIRGATGAAGKTPVKGVDYWTEADREAILNEVMQALSTPVYGRVDEENNIIITAQLADGTYTLKYENADGTKVDIGIVELGGGYVVVDESGPIALTMTYGVKLDKNTGAEGSGTGYAASQSIPYDSAYEYTMATTNDKHAYGAACWYDASGSYLGWNDIIATGTSGVTNSGVLKPLAGASTFRLRIVALNSGDESRISLRKDLIQ